jgi:hypothetical protein
MLIKAQAHNPYINAQQKSDHEKSGDPSEHSQPEDPFAAPKDA